MRVGLTLDTPLIKRRYRAQCPATLRWIRARQVEIESPFAFAGRYPLKGDVISSPRRALPQRLRSYGLMRRIDHPFLSASASCSSPGLCRWLSAPAGCRSFPTLSLRIFPRMSGPLPRRVPRCAAHFFPRDIGLPHVRNGSAFPAMPRTWRLLCGTRFRGCRHFLMTEAIVHSRTAVRVRCFLWRRAIRRRSTRGADLKFRR